MVRRGRGHGPRVRPPASDQPSPTMTHPPARVTTLPCSCGKSLSRVSEWRKDSGRTIGGIPAPVGVRRPRALLAWQLLQLLGPHFPRPGRRDRGRLGGAPATPSGPPIEQYRHRQRTPVRHAGCLRGRSVVGPATQMSRGTGGNEAQNDRRRASRSRRERATAKAMAWARPIAGGARLNSVYPAGSSSTGAASSRR